MKKLLIVLLLLTSAGLAQSEEETTPYTPPDYNIQIPNKIDLTNGLSIPLPQGGEPLSIQEAVNMGLATHENIDEARAAVAQAVARIAQSKAPGRPQVNLSASYQTPLYFHAEQFDTSGIPGLGDAGGFGSFFAQAPEGFTESVTVRQLLFDFNQTRSAIRAARANARAAEAGVELAQQQLAFDIRSNFLELLQSQRLAEVRMLALENQAIHIKEAEKLFDLGIGLPVDVVRAQTEYANSVQQFTESRNQAMIDRVELATLIGVDPRTPFEIEAPESAINTELDLQSLIDTALGGRPALAQTQAQLEAQNYQLENAKASNNPRITTTLNFAANQVTPQPKTEQISLMFNLEWPLYDGGLSAAQADEARAGIELYEARLSRLQRQIVQEVSTSYIRLQNAAQQLRTNEVAVKGAEESVRVATGRYKLGLGDFLEVLDAEQALVTARTNRVNSLAQLEQAEAALRFATGLKEATPEEPAETEPSDDD